MAGIVDLSKEYPKLLNRYRILLEKLEEQEVLLKQEKMRRKNLSKKLTRIMEKLDNITEELRED